STNCRVCLATCRSEPQIPQQSVLTRTCPAAGTGSGIPGSPTRPHLLLLPECRPQPPARRPICYRQQFVSLLHRVGRPHHMRQSPLQEFATEQWFTGAEKAAAEARRLSAPIHPHV